MQVEMYRGPKTGMVVAGAVIAIAVTIAILLIAGSAADGSNNTQSAYSQASEIISPAAASAANQDAPMSYEEIRFLEINELPEISAEYARLVETVATQRRQDDVPSLEEQRFLELNTQLPDRGQPASIEEIKFLEANIWGE